jgi:radical SAM protein with 4Fe4S-binding SPASM domain
MDRQPSKFFLKEIKVEVTHVCHLRCAHCSSIASINNLNEMSWIDCEKIIVDAAEMGVTTISFSGGEPLLWHPLVDAVRLASFHGMSINLYSSGTICDAELFERLKTAGVQRIMFSLFGVDADHHENITGIAGSYELTLESVAICNRIGLKTEFHFVPLSDNYFVLNDLAKLAKINNVDRVSILRLVPQGRAKDIGHKQLNREQNIWLRETICSLRNDGHNIRIGSPYNFLMLKDKPQCNSGIDRLTIGPDLRIFPCDAFKQISPADIGVSDSYSNLSEHSLADCWINSPYLNCVRKYLSAEFAAECTKCACLDKCHSGCIAQKIHAHGDNKKRPDPMCLMRPPFNEKHLH